VTTIPRRNRALSSGALAPGAGVPHGRETITYNAGVDGTPYHADRRKVRILPGGLLSDGTILGTERTDWVPGFHGEVVFGKTKGPKGTP
jgi:hypothetical protein